MSDGGAWSASRLGADLPAYRRTLGFSSWLGGDGAKVWCALDQIPEGPPYPMAALIATVLREGGHPDLWERAGATGPETEIYDPPSPTHRHERDIPSGPEAPGRGAPPR